jgi:hypothetical protein
MIEVVVETDLVVGFQEIQETAAMKKGTARRPFVSPHGMCRALHRLTADQARRCHAYSE